MIKLFFAIIAMVFCSVAVQAQIFNFPIGSATEVTSDDDSLTISLTPKNSVEFVTIASTTLDTNTTINVTTTYAKTGYIIYIKATADATTRGITFGTGITGTVDSVTASKTDIFQAVFDGTNYLITTAKQTN